jgi:hypothetical protein
MIGMTMRLSILAACAALVFAGCASPTDDTPYTDMLVVNAYLIAGQPIDSVTIQRTMKVTDLYSSETSAIANATVIIDGQGLSDTLLPDPLMRGHYISRHRDRLVAPGASYALTVRVPGYAEVTGTTTVPDTFSVTNAAAFPAAASYAPSVAPFGISWTPSRNFADYLVVVRSVDLASKMIPKSFSQEQAPDRTSVGFFLQDATTSEISWLYINYYGRTQISVVAVDKNYFDYLKQAVVAQGASDIRELRYNLHGALGIFGAETVATNRIEMTIVP